MILDALYIHYLIEDNVLAATIGVHRAVEADVRRLVAADHRLRQLAAHLGGQARRRFVLEPAIVLGLRAGRGETVVRVASGAATARRDDGHGEAPKYCI